MIVDAEIGMSSRPGMLLARIMVFELLSTFRADEFSDFGLGPVVLDPRAAIRLWLKCIVRPSLEGPIIGLGSVRPRKVWMHQRFRCTQSLHGIPMQQSKD